MSKKLIEQLHPVGFATQAKRIEELERKVASRDAEVAELKKEVEEDSALRERLAKILAEVAIALKGQEGALTRHSWHDLAQCAIDVVKERDQLSEQLEQTRTNDRIAMWYLADIKAAIGHDGDYPSLIALAENLREQLAAAQATIKAKDDYLRLLIGYTSESTVASLIVQKALAATQDLSGLVLCEADPVGKYTGTEKEYGYQIVQLNCDVEIGTLLYKAK